MGCGKDIVEHCGVPRLLFSDFPLGNSAGKPFDVGSQRETLELALRVLETAPAAHTTVQNPQRWSEDASWKRDFSNIDHLSPEELDDILTETFGVMEHPDHAALFGTGSLAEVPLTGVIVKGGEKAGEGGESHVISGQLDRLLVTDDAVTVIDYKTNRPPPETEDAVDPAYLRQMAAYREVLREIYPGRPVRAVLLWTVGPRMMALGDDILDAHAP